MPFEWKSGDAKFTEFLEEFNDYRVGYDDQEQVSKDFHRTGSEDKKITYRANNLAVVFDDERHLGEQELKPKIDFRVWLAFTNISAADFKTAAISEETSKAFQKQITAFDAAKRALENSPEKARFTATLTAHKVAQDNVEAAHNGYRLARTNDEIASTRADLIAATKAFRESPDEKNYRATKLALETAIEKQYLLGQQKPGAVLSAQSTYEEIYENATDDAKAYLALRKLKKLHTQDSHTFLSLHLEKQHKEFFKLFDDLDSESRGQKNLKIHSTGYSVAVKSDEQDQVKYRVTSRFALGYYDNDAMPRMDLGNLEYTLVANPDGTFSIDKNSVLADSEAVAKFLKAEVNDHAAEQAFLVGIMREQAERNPTWKMTNAHVEMVCQHAALHNLPLDLSGLDFSNVNFEELQKQQFKISEQESKNFAALFKTANLKNTKLSTALFDYLADPKNALQHLLKQGVDLSALTFSDEENPAGNNEISFKKFLELIKKDILKNPILSLEQFRFLKDKIVSCGDQKTQATNKKKYLSALKKCRLDNIPLEKTDIEWLIEHELTHLIQGSKITTQADASECITKKLTLDRVIFVGNEAVEGKIFKGISLKGIKFRCKVNEVVRPGANLQFAQFVNCNLTGADFTGVTISNKMRLKGSTLDHIVCDENTSIQYEMHEPGKEGKLISTLTVTPKNFIKEFLRIDRNLSETGNGSLFTQLQLRDKSIGEQFFLLKQYAETHPTHPVTDAFAHAYYELMKQQLLHASTEKNAEGQPVLTAKNVTELEKLAKHFGIVDTTLVFRQDAFPKVVAVQTAQEFATAQQGPVTVHEIPPASAHPQLSVDEFNEVQLEGINRVAAANFAQKDWDGKYPGFELFAADLVRNNFSAGPDSKEIKFYDYLATQAGFQDTELGDILDSVKAAYEIDNLDVRAKELHDAIGPNGARFHLLLEPYISGFIRHAFSPVLDGETDEQIGSILRPWYSPYDQNITGPTSTLVTGVKNDQPFAKRFEKRTVFNAAGTSQPYFVSNTDRSEKKLCFKLVETKNAVEGQPSTFELQAAVAAPFLMKDKCGAGSASSTPNTASFGEAKYLLGRKLKTGESLLYNVVIVSGKSNTALTRLIAGESATSEQDAKLLFDGFKNAIFNSSKTDAEKRSDLLALLYQFPDIFKTCVDAALSNFLLERSDNTGDAVPYDLVLKKILGDGNLSNIDVKDFDLSGFDLTGFAFNNSTKLKDAKVLNKAILDPRKPFLYDIRSKENECVFRLVMTPAEIWKEFKKLCDEYGYHFEINEFLNQFTTWEKNSSCNDGQKLLLLMQYVEKYPVAGTGLTDQGDYRGHVAGVFRQTIYNCCKAQAARELSVAANPSDKLIVTQKLLALADTLNRNVVAQVVKRDSKGAILKGAHGTNQVELQPKSVAIAEKHCVSRDLSRLNLRRVIFPRATIDERNIANIDFYKADLRGAKFAVPIPSTLATEIADDHGNFQDANMHGTSLRVVRTLSVEGSEKEAISSDQKELFASFRKHYMAKRYTFKGMYNAEEADKLKNYFDLEAYVKKHPNGIAAEAYGRVEFERLRNHYLTRAINPETLLPQALTRNEVIFLIAEAKRLHVDEPLINLSSLNFTNCDLSGVNVEKVKFDGAVFENVTVSAGTKLTGATFVNITGANFKFKSAEGVVLARSAEEWNKSIRDKHDAVKHGEEGAVEKSSSGKKTKDKRTFSQKHDLFAKGFLDTFSGGKSDMEKLLMTMQHAKDRSQGARKAILDDSVTEHAVSAVISAEHRKKTISAMTFEILQVRQGRVLSTKNADPSAAPPENSAVALASGYRVTDRSGNPIVYSKVELSMGGAFKVFMKKIVVLEDISVVLEHEKLVAYDKNADLMVSQPPVQRKEDGTYVAVQEVEEEIPADNIGAVIQEGSLSSRDDIAASNRSSTYTKRLQELFGMQSSEKGVAPPVVDMHQYLVVDCRVACGTVEQIQKTPDVNTVKVLGLRKLNIDQTQKALFKQIIDAITAGKTILFSGINEQSFLGAGVSARANNVVKRDSKATPVDFMVQLESALQQTDAWGRDENGEGYWQIAGVGKQLEVLKQLCKCIDLFGGVEKMKKDLADRKDYKGATTPEKRKVEIEAYFKLRTASRPTGQFVTKKETNPLAKPEMAQVVQQFQTAFIAGVEAEILAATQKAQQQATGPTATQLEGGVVEVSDDDENQFFNSNL